MAKIRYTAKTADKNKLYEESVQCPEADVRFIDRIYKKEYGIQPMILREDFCGTALFCAEWVKSNQDRTAIGIDLEPEVLRWGKEHNLKPLGKKAARITLKRANVLKVRDPKADILTAFNFSYFVFKSRKTMLEYFKTARKSLKKKGLFFLDLLGGPDAQNEMEEERELEGFDYVWDQDFFNPVNHDYRCYIHFNFPDGSRMRKAFVYEWRLWSLMELQDILQEAGFKRTDVYWEGTDRKTDEGNGVFRKVAKADNDEAWVSYIVAVP